LAGLKRVFKNKVIPLLEEYFHGDAFKVGAVLGDAFVEKQKGKVSFAKGFDMEDYEVKEIHRLKDVDLINDPEVFKAIYAN
ncbi:MAG: hypothetical protein KDC00_14530, partial [Flavobacteriales bacterium]|nr:hypothetical protein [Flavobacteriales bacterium]